MPKRKNLYTKQKKRALHLQSSVFRLLFVILHKERFRPLIIRRNIERFHLVRLEHDRRVAYPFHIDFRRRFFPRTFVRA